MKTESEYSMEELKEALASLARDCPSNTTPMSYSDCDQSCRHIYGYCPSSSLPSSSSITPPFVANSCNFFQQDHKLSMLQIITAHRILDYQRAYQNHDTTRKDETTINHHQPYVPSPPLPYDGPILHLLDQIQSQAPAMALAAEFKRASPSKGSLIASDSIRIEDQVHMYAEAGACIISVLTEPRWFQGSLEDLTKARIHTSSHWKHNSNACRPAILRKDFCVSRYMIAEAVMAGADTILLIVAITPLHLLRDLISYSREVCQMEPLVEVHTLEELDVALQAHAKVIGVNNRNLHTFHLDLSTTDRVAQEMTKRQCSFEHYKLLNTSSMDVLPVLHNNGTQASHVPKIKNEYALCALSGMSTAHDVDRYRQQGIGMCLIGESLMRAADPKAAILSLCLHPDQYQNHTKNSFLSTAAAYTGGTKLVKICGITDPTDALWACQCGANLIGIIFVPKSKRCVKDLQTATDIVNTVRSFGEREDRVMFPMQNDKHQQDVASSLSPLQVLRRNAKVLEEIASRRPLVVGVFQNQSEDYIRSVVQQCGLDLVQLHGQEGMQASSQERCLVPAIRVVDVETSPTTSMTDLPSIDAATNEGSSPSSVDSEVKSPIEKIMASLTSDPFAILLDTSIKGNANGGGGTGMTFDWSLAEAIQNRGLPVLIAGGLNVGNISNAIQSVRPWGVDVSSGVEISPGKKDADAVQTFLSCTRQAAIDASKGF